MAPEPFYWFFYVFYRHQLSFFAVEKGQQVLQEQASQICFLRLFALTAADDF